MAQHKSAIKAHKQSLIRAKRNSYVKTRIKNSSKAVLGFCKAGNADAAVNALRLAESIIMKAVTKKVLKLRTASRKVSNLCKRVKAIG